MSADVAFRCDTATRADVEAHLAQCDRRFVPPLGERVSIPSYAAKLRERGTTFEAWQSGTLVGLVAAYVEEGSQACFVSSVSVVPEMEGRGLATRLMETLAANLRARGVRLVTLEVARDSPAARRLYDRQGFMLVEDRESTLVLQRDLRLDLPPRASAEGVE